ncbi:DMT family transporter [Fructobacillus ficulneus]|uniref:EamA domain-containing protein n=1 Tax=Fructobacillus ficulneus TaxID=157463 RepID=A0A0K8MII7_9LACO|nr:DMT family transporter [Fructobacillus ficulneus]GAP00382.1 hypothetical protein FFIC_283990 [Fructobacillus ficulneus]
MKKSQQQIGLFFAIAGASFWGLSGVASQYLFHDTGVLPTSIVALRLLIGGLLALLLAVGSPRLRTQIWAIWRDPADRKRLLLFSLFGFLPSQLSYFLSISYGNVAAAAALQFLSPTFTLVYLIVGQRYQPKMLELLTILISVVGTILLITDGQLAVFAIAPLAIFWGLVSGMGQVAYSILPKPLLEKYDTSVVVGWGMFLGGIPLGPAIFRDSALTTLSAWQWTNVVFIILIGTLAACLCYINSLKYLAATVAQMLGSFEPLTATVFSVLVLNQHLGLVEILGMILIISVVFIQSRKNEPEEITTADLYIVDKS